MFRNVTRLVVLGAALALAACGGVAKTKCKTQSDCTTGQVCAADGFCASGSSDGGATGGSTGGGTGGGSTGGGTGGGATGGGTGGSSVGGETCAAATTASAGTLNGTTVGAADDLWANDNSCFGYELDGPDVVYKVTVPAGQKLTASVTPELADGGLQYDPAIYLVAAPASNCAEDRDAGTGFTCLAHADVYTASDTDTVGWLNAGSSSQDVFVVIDSSASPTSTTRANQGKFSLELKVGALPAGDSCANPTPLPANTTVANQDLNAFSDDYQGNGTACAGGSGNDRAYTVSVPAGQRLTLVGTPDTTVDLALNVSTSAANCDVTCEAYADNGGSGDPETLVWSNTTSSTVTAYVVVDSFSGDVGGFGLSATVGAPPAGDLCDTATTATGTVSNQVLTGFVDDYQGGDGCPYGTGGEDRVYAVSVPNNQRVRVTVSPDAGFDPSIMLVQGATAAVCTATPMVCVAGMDHGTSGDPESASWFNGTGATAQVYAIVDTSGGNSATDFSLTVATDTPAAGDVCATAAATSLPLAATSGQSTAAFAHDYDLRGTNCKTHHGFDRVYQFTVPTGKTLHLVVTPSSTDDAVISLMASPASTCTSAADCLDGVDANGDGGAETIDWVNSTGASATVYAIVSGYADGAMTYAIEAAAN